MKNWAELLMSEDYTPAADTDYIIYMPDNFIPDNRNDTESQYRVYRDYNSTVLKMLAYYYPDAFLVSLLEDVNTGFPQNLNSPEELAKAILGRWNVINFKDNCFQTKVFEETIYMRPSGSNGVVSGTVIYYDDNFQPAGFSEEGSKGVNRIEGLMARYRVIKAEYLNWPGRAVSLIQGAGWYYLGQTCFLNSKKILAYATQNFENFSGVPQTVSDKTWKAELRNIYPGIDSLNCLAVSSRTQDNLTKLKDI